MSRFNTGNPLGSGDPRDLDDNAKNMDVAVNSDELSWDDRFGRERKSFEGMEQEFSADQSRRESEFKTDQADRDNAFESAQDSREVRFNDFIAASGYQFLGDYAAGLEFTEYNQLVRDENGEFWRVSGQVDLPYVTTGAGIPEGDALVPAGDAVLRQELANPDKGAAMVAFQQLGTSAVPRTMLEKTREAVSVTDFFVAGHADWGMAVQAAIDYLTPTGGEILFPPGIYDISGSVVATAATGLVFRGNGATIRQTRTLSATLRLVDCVSPVITGLNFVGVGTEYDGARTSFNGVAGVYLSNCSGARVEGNTFSNHAGGSIRWTVRSVGLKVLNNTVRGVGVEGGIEAGGNGGDFGVGGWAVTLGSVDTIITGNDISGHAFGIGFGGKGAVVAGNIIHDIPGQHGMYFSSLGGAQVYGNLLYNIANEGIKNQISASGTEVRDFVVRGNILHDIGQTGIVVDTTSGTTGSLFRDASICGNIISRCGNYGISFGSCVGAVVENNVVVDVYGIYGFILRGFQGSVVRNMLRNTNGAGIYATITGDTHIADNTLTDCSVNSGGSSGTQHQSYLWVAKHSGTGGTPELLLEENRMLATSPDGPTLNWAIYVQSGMRTHYLRNDNYLTKPIRTATDPLETASFYAGHSPLAALTVGAVQNPDIPIYGFGARHNLYGNQDPASAGSSGSFIRGDVCWNSAPTTGGFVGWVCTTAGSPGVWKGFGEISV